MKTREGFRGRLLFLFHWIGFLSTGWIIYWVLREATEWPSLLGVLTMFFPLILGWLIRYLYEGKVSPWPWKDKKTSE